MAVNFEMCSAFFIGTISLYIGKYNYTYTGPFKYKVSCAYANNTIIKYSSSTYSTGQSAYYSYTGNYQTFVAPCDGTYKFEVWGAQAGSYPNGEVNNKYGAYASGKITLSKNTTLYIYVGQGRAAANGASFNGTTSSSGSGHPGGGASDIRTVAGSSWTDAKSLRSRIMVAGGGGGACYGANCCSSSEGGAGGGLTGYNSSCGGGTNTGGTQISGGTTTVCGAYVGGSFGIGSTTGATGGGGWYGGGGACHAHGSGAGGSSYISGHPGCIGVNSSGTPLASIYTALSNSYSHTGYIYTDTLMIDGLGYRWTTSRITSSYYPMPNPTSTGNYANGVGNTNNGYARITLITAT